MSDIRIVWDDAVAHGDWLLRPLSSSTEQVIVSAPTVFGTGDGVRTQFQLANPPVIDLVAKIFRNDWQGNQRLYPTPRTNFVDNSAYTASSWGRSTTAVVTENAGLAPDGVSQSAFLSSSASGNPYTWPGSSSSTPYVAGRKYTASVMLRANPAMASKRVRVLLHGNAFGGPNIFVMFNAQSGALSVYSANQPEAYGAVPYGNGWYRVWLTHTAVTTVSTYGPLIWWDTNINPGEGVEFWGLQGNEGDVLSSYIPTSGAPVTVTDYAVSSTGLITMGQVPAIGAALTWTGSYSKPISVGTGDLESGADLATAMLLSIFTDAMAASDEVIPDGTGDPRGWWGDQFDPDEPLGSKLWLLHREKQTRTTLNRAYDYLVEALKWLVDDGVVARFEISVEWVRESFLGAQIIAYSPDGTSLHTGKYLWAWNGIN